MPEWLLVEQGPATAFWRDRAGDVISLSLLSPQPLPAFSDAVGTQRYCRRIAQSQHAGLVEVATASAAEGHCLTYIYKRLEKPAFKFFGVAIIPTRRSTLVWMVLTGERGTTGIREAAVTARLLEAGQLTPETYEVAWASDPYEPAYAGVDKSTLRYVSDAETYDSDFPDHPLTKVRRELRRLLAIQVLPPPKEEL